MKIKTITYWISTALTAAMMVFSAFLYLTRQPKMMAAFDHLGYPAYFPAILGVAKLLGSAALLAPRLGLLKEWAYAGFTFTFLGAFVSHLSAGDGGQAVVPLVSLGLLALSYLLRPESRRVGSMLPPVAAA